ncbi:HIT family protein [soil metagenome]
MNFWEPCWACRLVSGENVGCIVEKTKDVFVAINPFSISAGHCLVLPRKHLKNVYELEDEELAGAILGTAAQIARAAKTAFGTDGITLRQNNEAASDQHLFHFHLHVIPRFDGDTEKFNASPEISTLEDQEKAAAKLRAKLT